MKVSTLHRMIRGGLYLRRNNTTMTEANTGSRCWELWLKPKWLWKEQEEMLVGLVWESELFDDRESNVDVPF